MLIHPLPEQFFIMSRVKVDRKNWGVVLGFDPVLVIFI